METVVLKHNAVYYTKAGTRIEYQSTYVRRHRRRMYRYKVEELQMSPFMTLPELNKNLKKYKVVVKTR